MAQSQSGFCVAHWISLMPDLPALQQAILNAQFVYTPRPNPVPGDLRMSWGISILVLALYYSRGKKSNFQKLQFLAHAVRVGEGREEVRGLLSGKYRPVEVSVRVEPYLNRAVSFAHSLRLVEIDKGTALSLTAAGARVAMELENTSDLLEEERQFLREVAPKMTEALMRRVWRLEDLL
jgi:hypothetical protein